MSENHETISPAELEQALKEYVNKANASPRARKTLAGWTCRIHIQATDVEESRFTYVVEQGASQPVTRRSRTWTRALPGGRPRRWPNGSRCWTG